MLGFFTRLPVPNIEFTEERFQKAMKLTPLAGLVIGLILTLISLVLYKIHTANFISGAVLICSYIAITGGLHFDGLADTCDGVFSGRSREQSLEIMKDSRTGVFGVLGLFMTGLLYFVLFTETSPVALLIFPIVGRSCYLISATLGPYAREDGMGKSTGNGGGPVSVASAIIALVGGSFLPTPFIAIPFLVNSSSQVSKYALWPPAFYGTVLIITFSLAASGVAVIATVLMTTHFRKKLGGVTGDTFGAVIEVSSVVYLLFFTILHQSLPL